MLSLMEPSMGVFHTPVSWDLEVPHLMARHSLLAAALGFLEVHFTVGGVLVPGTHCHVTP